MSRTRDDTIDFTMMYATHNAFRRDLGRLVHTAKEGMGNSPGVRQGWKNFKTQLLLHHSVEDANLWPRLRTALADQPGDLVLVDEMEAEHGQLEPVLAAVEAALAGRPNVLASAIQELRVVMEHHLEHEEDDALPLIQSVLGPADWAAFANEMRRRQGIKGAAVYVPWVLDGAPRTEQQQFLAALPAPVRVIAHLLWEPRYRKRNFWNM
jgi:iron-sulfur cluster repair protein YtfE (RIC family)